MRHALLVVVAAAAAAAAALTAVAAPAAAAVADPPAITFTGDVAVDFAVPAALRREVRRLADVGFKDVGVPSAVVAETGYDMDYVALYYERATDALHVGVRCYGVCGDADGDGDPDATSAGLASLGGVDNADFADTESYVLALDLDSDGRFDLALGYPAGAALDSDPLPCDSAAANAGAGATRLGSACFGLYYFSAAPNAARAPQFAFKWVENDPNGLLPHPTIDHNSAPSVARPGLEWTVSRFNDVRRKLGATAIDRTGNTPWSLTVFAYAGSFDDDGVGEDSVPNAGGSRLTFDLAAAPPTAAPPTAAPPTAAPPTAAPPTAAPPTAAPPTAAPPTAAPPTAAPPTAAPPTAAPPTAAPPTAAPPSPATPTTPPPTTPAPPTPPTPTPAPPPTDAVDCAGTVGGTLQFDPCGVCGGDGTTCIDCLSSCFAFARCYFPSLFNPDGSRAFRLDTKVGSCKNC